MAMNADQFSEIGPVLVVDDDRALSTMVGDALHLSGIIDVEQESDGRSALSRLDEEVYDLIILDWKIPYLSGAAVFNRLRRKPGYEDIPIVIISGFINSKDFRLLEEFPFTTILEKPFNQTTLQNAVAKVLEERAWFRENEKCIHRFKELCQQNPQGMVQEIALALTRSPNPLPLGLYVGRYLINERKFECAEAVLRHLLHICQQSPLARTELGRLYLLTNRFPEARQILDQAQEISPDNVDRLCLLGKLSINTMEPEQAIKSFETALKIDPEDPEAVSGRSMALELQGYMRNSMSQVPRSFASFVNAQGVCLVRSGDFLQGIEHYHNALRHVALDDDKSRLAFNLGLGFFRWRNMDEARKWFTKSLEYSQGKFTKAMRYLSMIQQLSEKPQSPSSVANTGPNKTRLEMVHAPNNPANKSPATSARDGKPAQKQRQTKFAKPKEYSHTSTSDTEPQIADRSDLMARFPDVRQAMKILRDQGEYVDALFGDFIRLAKSHDPQLFRSALQAAIREKRPTPRHVAFKLERLASENIETQGVT